MIFNMAHDQDPYTLEVKRLAVERRENSAKELVGFAKTPNDTLSSTGTGEWLIVQDFTRAYNYGAGFVSALVYLEKLDLVRQFGSVGIDLSEFAYNPVDVEKVS